MDENMYQLRAKDGKIYPIGTNGLTIGSQADNDLVLLDSTVSPRHARILYADNRCFVRDESGAKGTFINGQQIIGQRELKSGEILRIGSWEYRLEAVSSTAAPAVLPSPAAMAPAVNTSAGKRTRSGLVIVLVAGGFLLLLLLLLGGTGMLGEPAPVIFTPTPSRTPSTCSLRAARGSRCPAAT